jgi:hypothetical protein
LLPLDVCLPLRYVDRSIHFDGKSLLMAVEVEDKASDGMLPPKLTAGQAPVAQCRPEKAF